MVRAFRRLTIVSASGAFWAGRNILLLDENAGAERRDVFGERFEIGRVETSGETESVDGDGSRGTHVAKTFTTILLGGLRKLALVDWRVLLDLRQRDRQRLKLVDRPDAEGQFHAIHVAVVGEFDRLLEIA